MNDARNLGNGGNGGHTAFLFVDTDEDDVETAHGDALPEDEDPSVDIIPLDDLLDPDGGDTIIFSGNADDIVRQVRGTIN
ncbi:MAG: hypothetical protein ACJAVT_001398 [Yoonia sp.]|jgi:hypothetical protein